jgi:hypothetical protein
MSRNLFNSLSMSSIGTPSLAPPIPQFYLLRKPNTTGYTGNLYSEMAILDCRFMNGLTGNANITEHYIDVYAATSSITSPYSVVGRLYPSQSVFGSATATITGLTPGNLYYFKLRAADTSSGIIIESGDSVIMSASTSPYITASGGTIVTADGFRTHTFTSSGTLTVTRGGSGVHVVAIGSGGGGGAGINDAFAGGGGAGGYSYESGSFFLWSGSYTVTVGDVGLKGTYYFDEENQQDVLNNDETDGAISRFTGSVIKETISYSSPLSVSGDFGRKGVSADGTGTSGGRAGNRIINGISLTPTFYSGGFSNGVYGGGGGGAGGHGASAGVSANGAGGTGVTFFGTTYATGSAGGSNIDGTKGAVIIRYRYVP